MTGPSINTPLIKFFKSIQDEKTFIVYLTIIYIVLFALSYAKWGLVIVDCFHEMFIAKKIVSGAVLYKDISYLYGPFVPYLLVILFKIFGINLNVVFILGGIIGYIYTLLLYLIIKPFFNKLESTLCILLFWSVCLFSPILKGYIFPYSTSASIGCLVSLSVLYCILSFIRKEHKYYYYLASLLTGLSLLIKHEFALAALIIYIISSVIFLNKKLITYKDFLLTILIIFIIPFSIYFYLYQTFNIDPISEILLPKTFLTYTNYFTNNFLQGGISLAALSTGIISFTVVTVIYLLGVLYFILLRSFEKKKNLFYFIVLFIVIDLILLIYKFNLSYKIILFLTNNFLDLFAGLNFLVLIILIYLLINKLAKYRLPLTLIAIYSLVISIRTPLCLSLKGYATYYLPTVLFLMAYFLFHILNKFNKLSKYREILYSWSCLFLFGLIIFYGIYDYGLYQRKTYLFNNKNVGFIYIDSGLGKCFAEAVKYIKANTSSSDAIFVIPEEVSYYIFSDRNPPGKYYYLNPGTVANSPVVMNELIKEFDKNPPEYIILSNLPRKDFGVAYILIYYTPVREFIHCNYTLVKEITSNFPVDENLYYKISIFKHK